MTQDTKPDANLIPLLGHRSTLQMDLRDLEKRQLELSLALGTLSGRQHDVAESQLKSVEQQIQSTKAAMSAIDAQLTGQPIVAHTFTEIPTTPPPFVHFGGGVPEEAVWATGFAATLAALAIVAMIGYLRRVGRTTREALSAMESQISSHHATLASGIEAIAIEVERLGEGQRFMSKVLSSGEAKSPVPRTS